MTNEECIELLKRYAEYDGMGIPNLVGCREAMRMAAELLERPSLPSNLDEAAEEFCDNEFNEGSCTCLGMAVAFKAGAEWMAGQGVSYDCRCVEAFQRAVGGAMNAQFPFKDLGLKDGDEVIIQIRKK